jgi:uncharacterized protein (TIGR00251 family)
MSVSSPFSQTPGGGTLVRVRVTPRAGRSAIAGVRDGALLVRLAAAPVDGAANDALIDLLARALHLPKQFLRIIRGERSRDKQIAVDSLASDEVERRLNISPSTPRS